MKTTKFLFTVAAALSASIAALLWYKSSDVNVVPDPQTTDAQITLTEGQKESDFIATAREQTRWSKRAAAAACASAICQAITLLLP